MDFTLIENSDVTIDFFALNGTLVKSVKRNRCNPGNNQIILNNDTGLVPGEIYLVKFNSNQFLSSVKYMFR